MLLDPSHRMTTHPVIGELRAALDLGRTLRRYTRGLGSILLVEILSRITK